MAKRKLSESQRGTLRTALAKGLKAGRKVAELVKEAAEKYGITTITARYYLASIGRSKKTSKRSRRRKAPELTNGALPRFVKMVESKAASAAKKLREAQRLVPKWRDLVKKEHSLKSLESKVRRELTSVARKAKSLGARIRGLVGT